MTTDAQLQYDGDADILYISLGKPVAADDAHEANGIVHRFKDGLLIGLTILDLRERLHV